MNIQKKQFNKRAFTLVELIVVITILVILGTISFVSFQGYSKSARDSKRISDVQNIKKSLELFSLNTGKYPLPDNTYQALYSGSIIWSQGIVGENVVKNLSKNLQSKPLDPLTEKEYTYSVTNLQTEYEILSIYESDLISNNKIINKGYADSFLYTKIDGTYNQICVKTPDFIVPTPSIINSEIDNNSITLDSNNIKSQIITGGSNVIYNGKIKFSTGGIEGLKLFVYTGGINTLNNAGSKENLANIIINSYSGSVIENNVLYLQILNSNNQEQKIAFVDQFIFNKINPS